MGRPSKFKVEFVEKARELCENGATNRELADFFRVNETTIWQWAHTHPAFSNALKVGKDLADERVVQSLYRRAVGYSFDAVHISNYQGSVSQTPIVEHVPPDVTAGIFWLKNRRPAEWRDVKAVEHSGSVTHKHVSELTDDELAAIATGGGAGTAETPPCSSDPSGIH
jgi:hypothetical protein